jgi:hypothetical protein
MKKLLSRRASPLPAILLGAWLGAGAAAAQASHPRASFGTVIPDLHDQRQKPEEILHLVDEHGPRLADEITVTSILDFETPATTGALDAVQLGLRRLFAESELVALAVVEGSEILGTQDGYADRRTGLRIVRRFKGGRVAERKVICRHLEFAEQDSAESLKAGAPVLAFLRRMQGDDGLPWSQDYETMDLASGLRDLAGAGLRAYQERLDALASLDRRGKREPFDDAAFLMEWLVATAENPHTRHEAVGEIYFALKSFADLAENMRQSPTVAAGDLEQLVAGRNEELILLGATFSDRHRQRLEAALLANENLEGKELALYQLVHDWNLEPSR